MNAFLHPDQRQRYLTAKTRELIAACGGVAAAAEITRRGTSTVGRWQDFDAADSAPMVCIAMMETACGVPIVTAAIAAQVAPSRARADARVHMRTPARARECCTKAFAELHQQAGTLSAELVLALADGKVTPAEARTSSKHMADLRATLTSIETALHAAVPSASRLRVVDGEAG